MPASLHDAFVQALAPPRAAQARAWPELEAALARRVAEARQATPGIDVAPDAFGRYLAERVPPGAPLPEWLEATAVADLWLACACAGGSSPAIAEFERRHFSQIRVALGRRGALGFLGELESQLRETLFAPRPGQSPKISEYSGRGPLEAWFKMCVTRQALNLITRAKPVAPVEEAGALPTQALEDPELALFKRSHRDEFNAAFEGAVRSLSPQDRTLLQYRFVEGLRGEQIATLLRVDRATVTRRLARVRQALLAQVSSALGERLGLQADELNSLIRSLRSQLDVTLERLLGDG